MLRTSFFALASASLASPIAARACHSPYGITTLETPCYTTVVSSGDLSIRAYGSQNVTVVTGLADTDLSFDAALETGIYLALVYFEGVNGPGVNISRTVPFLARQPVAGTTIPWRVSMAVPPSEYPQPAAVPQPGYPLDVLEPFANSTRRGALHIAVQHFQTRLQPELADFKAACAALAGGVEGLQGWTVDHRSPWSPSFAIYNGRDTETAWDSECWLAVTKTAAD